MREALVTTFRSLTNKMFKYHEEDMYLNKYINDVYLRGLVCAVIPKACPWGVPLDLEGSI